MDRKPLDNSSRRRTVASSTTWAHSSLNGTVLTTRSGTGAASSFNNVGSFTATGTSANCGIRVCRSTCPAGPSTSRTGQTGPRSRRYEHRRGVQHRIKRFARTLDTIHASTRPRPSAAPVSCTKSTAIPRCYPGTTRSRVPLSSTGTLQVDGSLAGSAVSFRMAEGTLSGTGTVGRDRRRCTAP